MPIRTHARHALAALLALAASGAGAQDIAAPQTRPVRSNEARVQLADGIYRGLVAELENSLGQVGQGFDDLLAAARRSKGSDLYRRALELALQAGSQERAQRVVSAWRQAQPKSIEAMQRDVQFHLLTGQLPRAAKPLQDWLAATQDDSRVELIQALPRLLGIAKDRAQAQNILKRVLAPYRVALPTTPDTRSSWDTQTHVAAELAVAQLGPASGQADGVDWAEVQAIHRAWPNNRLPGIAALGLMPTTAGAEAIVQQVLAAPGSDALIPSVAALRQAYASVLARQKRYPAALAQLQQAAQTMKPAQAGSRPVWLALSATALSAHQWPEAERSVRRYLDNSVGWADALNEDQVANGHLLLAEIQQAQGQLPQALATLDRVNVPALYVLAGLRRAAILTQQKQWPKAQALIAALNDGSADNPGGALDPTVARQLQVLSEQKRWDVSLQVLDAALAKGRTAELLYQKAMVLDRLNRTAEMEALLTEALKLDPRHAGSQNALGYGWADRNVNLNEARTLIEAALQAQPDDPYILDSLGWVAFRQGRTDEALKHLQSAWLQSHDGEIAAHLGEVLWVSGQRDAAQAVWREGRSLAPDNALIQSTLKRLGVSL